MQWQVYMRCRCLDRFGCYTCYICRISIFRSMKHSYQCPKCQSTSVIKIEGNRMNQNQVVSLSKWGTHNVVLDRMLCTSCGFTEEWIKIDAKFERWVEKNGDKGDKYRSDFV